MSIYFIPQTIIWILLSLYPIYKFLKYIFNVGNFINLMMKMMRMNNNIHNKDNIMNINNEKVIIMANHYNGCDYGVIYKTFTPFTKKNIYTIAKSNAIGGSEEKNLLNNFLGLFRNYFFKTFKLIPLDRGNKNSGTFVKNEILKKINENDTILIFPEGTTTRNGKPKQFRKGIFELCAIEKIKVIPVTIKYNKDIGLDYGYPLKFSEWYNVSADVYIHDEIYDPNVDTFMEKVFDKISEPYI